MKIEGLILKINNGEEIILKEMIELTKYAKVIPSIAEKIKKASKEDDCFSN